MNTNRNGKIASLPRAIREQLNRRLEKGEKGKRLVAWLNELPEVQALVTAEFEGEPILACNLSRWTQGGGFEEWQAQEAALARLDRIVEDAQEIEGDKTGLLGDRLAVWLMSRLILAAGKLGGAQPTERDGKSLRELSRDVAELRKGDRGLRWVRLGEERLADERKERERKIEEERIASEQKLEELFLKWAENPDIREAICRGFKTHAEKLELFRKVMFADVDEYARTHPQRPIPGARQPGGDEEEAEADESPKTE